MSNIYRPRLSRAATAVGVVVLVVACAGTAFAPVLAQAAVSTGAAGSPPAAKPGEKSGEKPGEKPESTGLSLESAAKKADTTGRTIAMSLIGLALAIASIVLAFRRDFKEAAGVFVVGIVAVLLATPAGLNLLEDTVTSLFGS
jgi:hypothetical protein